MLTVIIKILVLVFIFFTHYEFFLVPNFSAYFYFSKNPGCFLLLKPKLCFAASLPLSLSTILVPIYYSVSVRIKLLQDVQSMFIDKMSKVYCVG